MKVIIIHNDDKLHHTLRKSFDSVDKCYYWLFNSVPEFYDWKSMIRIKNKINFRDLFAFSDTARLYQPAINIMPEYFTVVKIRN